MLSFEQTLNRELLQGRCLALELAAVLDRLDEAARREGRASSNDPRLRELRESISLLGAPSPEANRAERILRIYSLPET